MSGWFAVKRGISEHPLFIGNHDRLALWVWLLDHAAWKETRHDVRGKVITIMPGQVCVSLRRLSEETGVSFQSVRTALDRFKEQHMISTSVNTGRTIITLCNWDKYQTEWREANTPATRQQHSGNTQKKQGNKGTRKNPPNPPQAGGDEGKVVQLRSIHGTGHKAALAEAVRILKAKDAGNA